MCRLVKVNTGTGTVKVAGIKKKYIQNIAEAAMKCDYIDKVILFGSCIRNKCREDSDIDIAVFGCLPKGRCLTSKKYERFLTQVFSFDDFRQAYDILYFKTGSRNNGGIMREIENGEVLYVRTA